MVRTLGDGSISLGINVHDEAGPVGMVEHARRQAGLADRAGFDGVTISEHHGGFPGYLPQPTLAASWLLSEMPSAWAAPLPILLPLRLPALVAEELAWLAAAFPGRVAAGFAPGYRVDDFVALGLEAGALASRFDAGLVSLTRALRGSGSPSLAVDPALQALVADPLPMLSAVGSLTAARRAARHGLGAIYGGLDDPERQDLMRSAYRDAGGRGPELLIRRVWIGRNPPLDAVDRLRDLYRSADSSTVATAGSPRGYVVGSAEEIADEIALSLAHTRVSDLSLRFHLPGLTAQVVDEQIQRAGDELIPLLRAVMPRRSTS